MFGNRPGPTQQLRDLAQLVSNQLDDFGQELIKINRRLHNMATHDDLRAAEQAIKSEVAAAAERVAAKLQALQDKIDQGVPAEDFQPDVDALNADIEDLRKVGADATPAPAPPQP